MIKIYAHGVWVLSEELPHTIYAGTELEAHIDEMASNENFISLETEDPVLRDLCDLWDIPYEKV